MKDEHWVVIRADGTPCECHHPSERHARACLALRRRVGRAGYGEGATVGQWVREPDPPWTPDPWGQLAILGWLAILIILCGGAY